jgi:GDP-4-dehydro-6-deoxy-D-mannose reductase
MERGAGVRAIVTGASGFVGAHLVRHLEAAGDEVAGLDRGVDVTDPEAVRAFFARHRPEAVYHLAAVSHVGSSWSAPLEVFRVNALGALNVLRAALDAGASRVLLVGSADQYGAVGEADLPITEDAPLRPVTPYGASKVAAEFLGLQAHLGDGLPVIRVRAFNHTGAGQGERFLVPALARRIAEAEKQGAKEVQVGSLDPVRDFTDVTDVVRAYRLLVERGGPGEVYNVCSGRGWSVGELAERILRLARHPMELVEDPDLVRPVDVPRLVGDNTRLRTATGWAPQVSLDDTLAAVLDHWRSHLSSGP